MTKNSPKYGFKKGDEFVVNRNIMNECVVIMDKHTPNLILSERKLKTHGTLTWIPQVSSHIENLTKLLEKLTHTFDTDTDIQKTFVGYDILRYDILDKTLRARMTGETNKMIFDVYAGNYDENFAKKCNIDFDETVAFLESFTKKFSNKHNGTIVSKDLFEALKAHMGHSVYIEGQYENENDAFDNPKGITVRCVELDCDDCMKTIIRLEKPDEETY